MWKKEVILNIENVYTANAFVTPGGWFIGAGSETGSEVYLYEVVGKQKSLVPGCPGGMMGFVPVPGTANEFVTVMGLFPPFKGLEAGLYHHRQTGAQWETSKVIHLPFAHRCEFLTRDNKRFLFAASVSSYKENPADWSRPGEIMMVEWQEEAVFPLQGEVIDAGISRNHGLLRHRVEGVETLLFSGKEGIFYLIAGAGNEWILEQLFEQEVSEFALIDLDGDGNDELITIEPFHGEQIRFYKMIGGNWELQYSDTLSFGHGLCSGWINRNPMVFAGNRSASLSLDVFGTLNLAAGKVERETVESGVGPTQTQVFSDGENSYLLSANQKKHEVALYTTGQ